VFGPALFTPLRGGQETVGTLSVLRAAGSPPFGPTDVELVSSFAAQAGVALEHERHRQELGRLQLLEDQERIARDLHDSVIQRVFAAGLSLQGAAGLVHDPVVRDRIETAIDELDTANRQIRAVIFDIGRSSTRAEDSVRRRVLDLTAEAGRALGSTPRVLFTGPVDTIVAEHVATELLSTLREALSNVAKHAQARVVEVDLAADTAGVTLIVRDDGTGIGADPAAQGGKGVANMRTRAERLGGNCTIAPAPGGGTLVEWRVPSSG
jgi:signal transduction histidine kinase